MSGNLYVQYGCAWHAPESWRNFDASPTLCFERLPLLGRMYTRNKERFPANVEFGDIVKGLPIRDGTCRAIYCSHVLEHLSLEECRKALRNTLRLLGRGGTFRLVLPDLEWAARKYLGRSEAMAAIDFNKETGLGREVRSRSMKAFVLEWLGNSQHLWGWDYKSLAHELAEAGFVDVRRAQFGDARDPMFGAVEQEERWRNCLGIECFRGRDDE